MAVNGRHVNQGGGSLDSVLDCISENLRGVIEELALLKTVTPKRKIPPLIDTELQLLINKRNVTDRR